MGDLKYEGMFLPNTRECYSVLEMATWESAVHKHRSHFGSRYKLGCCGHTGLLNFWMQEDLGTGKVSEGTSAPRFLDLLSSGEVRLPKVLALKVMSSS